MLPSRFVLVTSLTISLVLATVAGRAQSVRNGSEARAGERSAVLTTLVNFDGTNGDEPYVESLVQGKDGALYGTTFKGGGKNYGTVFKVTTTGALRTMHAFSGEAGEGISPYVGLVLGANGDFYGTTGYGGSGGQGTVFQMSPAGELSTLYTFDQTDGQTPLSPLLQTVDGSFYGTTQAGGLNFSGTVFNLTPSGTLTTVANFNADVNGFYPGGALVQASNGRIYGCVADEESGSVFSMTTGGDLTDLYSFGGSEGYRPTGLTLGRDGSFYGPVEFGSVNGYGEIYRLTTAGALTVLHSFDNSDGAYPVGAVLFGTDGNLYGTTYSGGTNGAGTIFQLTPAGTLTTLYNFSGTTDGSAPFSGLVQHTNGIFYGVTSAGGTDGLGTVFSLNMGLRPFVAFVQPTGKAGSNAQILGQGLTGTTSVTFNGVSATSFTVVDDTYMTAVVPTGATTGPVVVTTPGGALTSNVSFRITE